MADDALAPIDDGLAPIDDDDDDDSGAPVPFELERLHAWRAQGFSAEDTIRWLVILPRARFTPMTARAWTDEGFDPVDAAIWSEVFACPVRAREYRKSGQSKPSG